MENRHCLTSKVSQRGGDVLPKGAHTALRLCVCDDFEAEIVGIENAADHVGGVIRAGPGNGQREIDGILIRVGIAAAGVREQVSLVDLGEGAESRDEWDAELGAERRHVQVEVVEGRGEVEAVQAGGDFVLEVPVFAGVCVGEEADVAVEGRVAEHGFQALAFRGVVGVGALDGRIAGFDGACDAGKGGVRADEFVD